MVVQVPLTVAVFVLVFSTASVVQGVLPLEYSPHLDDYPVYITHRDNVISKFQLFNTELRKCRCDGNQVWDGSRCKDSQTFVVVLDLAAELTSVVNTSALGSVTVEEPSCPPGHSLAILDSNRNLDDQFCLLVSGNLYWQEVEFTNYCIDHTLNKEGEPRSWEAHVCLSPPQVPRCCVQGHTLAADDCTGLTNQIFSPPIEVDGVSVTWQEYKGEVVDITCTEPEETLRLRLGTDGAHLVYQSSNASVVWSSADSQKREQRRNYCVGVEAGRDYVVKFCFEDPLSNATCVRKCCPEAHLIEGFSCGQVKNESEVWEPSFYEADGLTPSSSPPEDLKIIYGFPLCHLFPLEPHNYESDKFVLLNDGSLHVSSYPEPYPCDRYCLDNFRSEAAVHAQALICFPEEPQKSQCLEVARNYLYPSLLLVSCVFLSLTLAMYGSVPELHHKLHGKCLMSLVSMLLLAYLTLATTRLAAAKVPSGLCKFMASAMHWSFLAAFFWLNVMCYDIWRTLSMMRTVSRGGRETKKRFRLYSLYSWGCSFLITIIAVIVEALPDTFNVIRPNFSDKTCWFQNTSSLWAYLYGFVLVLVLVNIVFFGMVARILIQSQNDPVLQQSRSQNRERLWLCMKLFLVMGVTWVTEVISWQEGSCLAWIVLDIVNSLQGFTIFLVFVCKKKNLHKVRDSCSGCCGWATMQVALSSSITLITGLSTTTRSSSHRTSKTSSDRGSHKPKGSLATSLSSQPCTQVEIPLGTIMEASHPSVEHNHHEAQPASGSDSDSEMPCGKQRETSCGVTNVDKSTVMISHNLSSGTGKNDSVLHVPESGAETDTEVTPLRTNESTPEE